MATIYKIYEIQNIGKGVITTLTPDNLLQFYDLEQGLQGLQQVLNKDYIISQSSAMEVKQQLYIGSSENYLDILNENTTDTDSPGIRLVNEIGATKAGILIYPDKFIAEDSIRQKGLEYPGDYSANFTANSLITKQYAQSLIPPAPTGAETKVQAGTNVTVTGSGTTATPYIINATSTPPTTPIKNVGFFSGLNPGITTVGTMLAVSGNITVAEVILSDAAGLSVVRCTVANAMTNTSYYVKEAIQSMGTFDPDSRVCQGVFKPVSTTQFDFALREASGGSAKNLKIHVEVVQMS